MTKDWPILLPMKNATVTEFHISRRARELYQFNESFFAASGNVIFPNFRAVRLFVQKMNEKKDLLNFPEQAVQPGQLNAMGLIDEILHFIVGLYRDEKNPQTMKQALDWLYEKLGKVRVDETLRTFTEKFPPLPLYKGEIELESYLEAKTEGVPNRHIILEEMLMLWLANKNPAFFPFIELFDHSALEAETSYNQIIEHLYAFFKTQPTFGPDDQHLIDMLRSPAIAFPHSLSGQLEYIRERWGSLLGRYLSLLLSGLDLIKEEEIAQMRRMALWTRPPLPVYEFATMEEEPERFSPDLEWMPRLVLLAKNIYVWLHQLSRKYQRSIYRLDQIPDEELDQLSQWGFTGLWLIGLWERSLASKTIKELLGNPDAVASAYSLFDYQIAGDLGGEEAFQNLKDRAWRHGIRLASDMVPNHMGIDSKWVIEHPEWFLSADESPFPTYSFNGPDLSWHKEVGIYLEDHYFDRSDAAVVFKRVDRRTGTESYIYHGNDGTRMPWNDTAQLNFLKEEVREVVIQTILHVARKFPILRFDAAMTLTKKHYQRLWFPEPGTGGAIPSRAEYGMSRQEFHRQMPEEFWRQVVDRIAREAPNTLLLAEAFWLLEGYFVRTLGMHRVYNSAFMNMLKDEENAKYRLVMKNTLEFNPEILKRFVNFMSNPDEETAIAQFGKEDKYFGICTLMVTLPGLPMFAHGQIEGFTEKYGMEYRYAKWEEQPDRNLIERHKQEIFPLMKRRHLFADVKHFLLYDFFTPEGYVNEDVFAYSNRFGEERAIVIYHNRYASTAGWIRTSAAYSIMDGSSRKLIQQELGEGLGLQNDPECFYIFRDHVSGLEYLRHSKELYEKGLYVELGAYKYHVFFDFQEIRDNSWHHYAQLNQFLNGRGVPALSEVLKEIQLPPLHHAFRELVNAHLFHRLMGARILKSGQPLDNGLIEEVKQKTILFLEQAKALSGATGGKEVVAREVKLKLEAILYLPIITSRPQILQPRGIKAAAEYLHQGLMDQSSVWKIIFDWLFLHPMGKIVSSEDFSETGYRWMGEWKLDRILVETWMDLGFDERIAKRSVGLVKILTRHQRWFEEKNIEHVIQNLLWDDEISQFLGLNQYEDILWFNKEAFEEMLWWLMLTAAIEIGFDPLRPAKEVIRELERCWSMTKKFQDAEKKSGYQVIKLLEFLKEA